MNPGMSDARIQIHLDVHHPIELVDLTLSFQAIAFEYRQFLSRKAKAQGKKMTDDDVRLYITRIENNCVLAELGTAVKILGQLFSVVDHANIFVEFVSNMKQAIDYFKDCDRTQDDPKNLAYTKAESGRMADLLDVVAKNQGGRLGMSVLQYDSTLTQRGPKTRLQITFSSEEAYAARQGALWAQKALAYRGDADYKRVLMYFHQTNLDDPKSVGHTGDKAIIKTISDKPLPVYFVSEIDQQKITYDIAEPHNNPFKTSYIVDVNVETDRNDVARAYRVTHVVHTLHEEDA